MTAEYRGWSIEYDAPWHCAYRDGKSITARSIHALRSMIDAREVTTQT